MSVFENLGEEKAKEMIDELISKGYSEDEAFTEVYSIECNMDEEEASELFSSTSFEECLTWIWNNI